MPHKNHNRDHKKRNVVPPAVGQVVEAQVFKITDFGAFVKLPGNRLGLIHISQIADDYVKNISDHLKVGDRVNARVVQVTADGKIDLTLKMPKEQTNTFPKNKKFKTNIFEEKMNEFLNQKNKQAKPDLETA